ncbi:glycosyltransferase [Providencia rettgeri]|uniref:glycosyltransferase n=1 Tax=Providencia sp. PROV137 TaxID=2949847 RepID=UPI00234B70B0|nr:glycosyltransferase [Providencia sp. PROV137]ELR5109038.1 glycosyltransferase [Providencia rettgeri]ELR5284248.1 glycosyltransferase [Providencia rettgeri]
MKIKILVLNINDLGGIERVAINLYYMFQSNHLLKDNIEILSVYGSSNEPYISILKGSSENKKLCNLAKSLTHDTILLSLYDRFSIKLAILKKFRKMDFKLYACQHADYFAHKRYTRFLRNIAYHWVDKIIALTTVDTKLYEKKFKNVCTIPNTLSFHPEIVSDFVDREIDCAVAGRLVPIKQYEHFIEFIKNTHCDGYNYKIFGDGTEYEKLRRSLDSLGINSNDILVGKTNNIEQYLCETKFFFVTSLRESFSMVILEAMACGCVVISYNCPTGPSELIQHNFNGILVPLNDLDSLTNEYKRLINDPISCQTISNNARYFSKSFLMKNIIKLWIKQFND